MAAKKSASKKAAPKQVAAKKTAAKKVAKRAPRVNRNPKPAPVEKLMELGDTGAFHVEAEFNDQVVSGRTDDIAESVMSLAPVRLNTKVVFKFSLATDEEVAAAAEDTENATPYKVVDKVLMVPFARRLFTNKMTALVFAKGVKMALGFTDPEGDGEETQ